MTTTAEKEYIISILAKNNPGVLLRISGLFSRRCYNILSIVAAQTENTEYSQHFDRSAGRRPHCAAGR